jgi:hypothetical protein
MEALLGTPMARSDENPLRWEGGPVALGPHYPEVKLKSAPTGHSVYEQALWAVSYDWGDLAFGIREKERCLTGISLERATG